MSKIPLSNATLSQVYDVNISDYAAENAIDGDPRTVAVSANATSNWLSVKTTPGTCTHFARNFSAARSLLTFLTLPRPPPSPLSMRSHQVRSHSQPDSQVRGAALPLPGVACEFSRPGVAGVVR